MGLNATVPSFYGNLLLEAREIKIYINDQEFIFIIDNISHETNFNNSYYSINGRSLTALLSSPYTDSIIINQDVQLTAEQLVDEILTENGVSIDFDVKWDVDD